LHEEGFPVQIERHYARTVLWILILVFCLALLGITWRGLELLQKRELTIRTDAAYKETANLSLTLAEHAGRTFFEVDHLLNFLGQNYQAGNNIEELHLLSFAIQNSQKNLFNLVGIIDDQGHLIASGQRPFVPVYSGDRDWFIFHRDHPGDTNLLISDPLLGRATNLWYIPITKRIENQNGRFLGVAIASVNPHYFLELYQSLDVGNNNIIALTKADGTILAGQIDRKALPFSILFTRAAGIIDQRRKVHDTFNCLWAPDYDDILRLTTMSPIAGQNIYTIVGVSQTEALAPARKSHRNFQQLAIVFTVLIVVFLTALMLTDARRGKAEKLLKQYAIIDSLTGLYNRNYFEDYLARHQKEATGHSAVVVADIDGLKLINDTLGHQAGDDLLIRTAHLLEVYFAPPALVCRIGGDEFAVMTASNPETAAKRCQLLRESLSGEHLQSTGIALSISIGFATGKNTLKELYKEADNHMYREKLHRQGSNRSKIIQTMMQLLAEKDNITEEHAERMVEYTRLLARAAGVNSQEISDLVLLAQFHDIGKVGISDALLNKTGPLTPEEYAEVKKHCEIGHRIAINSFDLAPIADWILHHQEAYDGSGYPFGLKGEEIPLPCRIIAIVDAFDAMTSDRPYRQAMPAGAALEEIRRCAGSQFDPRLTALFIQLVTDKNPS
jgi:diguanylate cyclase (GGDEF)-like protein